ncbi:hypothetical protein ACFQ6E_39065 [Streptomyces sp. NPDC056462]|uniref:hypothetical protein n=1 Tax=Streptomyces sp. NPDC056462 TaxID=3345826 RepID=UPI0036C20648
MYCALVLNRLSRSLAQRSETRGDAVGLLAEVADRLQDLDSVLSHSFEFDSGLETSAIIVAFAEQLKRLSVLVSRMFDDAYDNISEY